MHITSSSGQYAVAPSAAASFDGAAPSTSSKQQLGKLRLEFILKEVVDAAIQRDNDSMTVPTDEDKSVSIYKSEPDNSEELVPIDLKQMRKLRPKAENDNMDDNTTFGPNVGLGMQDADSVMRRQKVDQVNQKTEMLDGLMASLEGR